MPLAVGVAPLESVVVATSADGLTYIVALDDLPERFTVGRNRENHLRLADREVSSGRHCAFLRGGDGALSLESYRSVNGEYVNGERVQRRRPIFVGDVVTLGQSTLRFAHRRAALPSLLPPSLAEAIVAAPEELAPRLVAADWLLEQGDPRGELIQLQARLARGYDPSLAAAAEALLAEHEADWIAPLPVPVEHWTFEEGFISEVRVPSPFATPEALALLRAAHPIRRVITC